MRSLWVTLPLSLALGCGSSGAGASSAPSSTNQGGSGNSTSFPSAGSGNDNGSGNAGSTGFFTVPEAGLSSQFGGCATASATATLIPANLLFVIDRSGSMNCNAPPITSSADCEASATKAQANSPSKWETVRDSLKQALMTLPPTTGVGVTYFSNDNQCGVQSQPNVEIAKLDASQLSSLDASLDAVKPNGGTPLVGAVVNAYKRLNPNQYPNQPYGNKFVVLITDGEEDCVTSAVPDLLNTEAPKAIQAYIKTFVVGVPGSEVDRGTLSQLAFNGGTPSSPTCDHSGSAPDVGDCHFDMTKQTDLSAALGQALAAISGQALSCEFTLPPANGDQSVDPGKVNVQYTPSKGADPVQIAQDPNKPCSGGANGWQYENGNSKIIVCGAACDTVRSAYKIDIVLGCSTVIE